MRAWRTLPLTPEEVSVAGAAQSRVRRGSAAQIISRWEVFRRWRESEGRVAEALAGLGEELAAARDQYAEVKQLDETLFAKDYESL